MLKPLLLSAFAAFAVLASLPAEAEALPATPWTVDPAASTIQFSGTHAGKDFTGSFKTWSARIAFDAANLEGSSAAVTIDTGSATTGDKAYDGSLISADWLDVTGFPQAEFTTTAFRQTGDTTFEADGVLKIKGIEQKLTLPFTLTMDGNTAAMEAHLTLDRLALGIGQKADAGAEWVSRDIGVTITLKAAKAP